jgi:chromosome segregation ATPase
MDRKFVLWLGIITLMIIYVSCVPGGKYISMQDTSRQFMKERDDFKTDNINLEMQNKELEAKLASLEKEIGSVSQDLNVAKNAHDMALEDYNKILSKYNELQNAQEDLIKGNVSETQKLLKELQASQENLQKKEDLLVSLANHLIQKKPLLMSLLLNWKKEMQDSLNLKRYLMAKRKSFRI